MDERGVEAGLKRWQTGIFGIWYPIKSPAPVGRFLAELSSFGRPCLAAELYRYPPDDPERLNGCGFALLNPPWRLDEALTELLPILAARLGADGGSTMRWLVKEG